MLCVQIKRLADRLFQTNLWLIAREQDCWWYYYKSLQGLGIVFLIFHKMWEVISHSNLLLATVFYRNYKYWTDFCIVHNVIITLVFSRRLNLHSLPPVYCHSNKCLAFILFYFPTVFQFNLLYNASNDSGTIIHFPVSISLVESDRCTFCLSSVYIDFKTFIICFW